MDRITQKNIRAKTEQLNRVLAELGVDIDASIYGANGGWSINAFDGSVNVSQGIRTKREIYDQLYTAIEILYQVGRQQRKIKQGCCDNCTQDPNGQHQCRANESTCIDGKDCPDYIETCGCPECN